jgi:hypothetical protein
MIAARRRSSGFILLTALLMIGIVAIALLGMAEATSSRARRQFTDVQQAQLEQLLLAGAQDALNRYNSPSPPEVNGSLKVELPAGLVRNSELTIHIDSASEGASAVATIRATIDGRAASEVIHLKKAAPGWQLSAASLE